MRGRTDRRQPARRRSDPDQEALGRVHVALWQHVGELDHLLILLGGQVLIKDGDLRFVYANERFAREWGMAPEEVVGKTDFDLFPADQAERHRAEDRAVMREGEVKCVDRPPWRFVKVPIKDPEGKVVALAVSATWVQGQSVTERLFHYASVVLSSSDAIIGLSPDGCVQSWNPGAEAVYGYTEEDMLDHSIDELCPQSQRAGMMARLEEAAGGTIVRDYEATHVRKDGGRVAVSVTLSPVVGESRAVVGVSMVAHDITGRVRRQSELKQALSELASSHAELGSVAYSAASARPPGPHQEEVERLAAEIRADPYRDVDVGDCARRLHVSPGYFRRLFRKYMGRAPHDYLLTWRMRKAARALRDDPGPVKAVAHEAGYDDPARFSKLFKEKIGMSPSQYCRVMRSL